MINLSKYLKLTIFFLLQLSVCFCQEVITRLEGIVRLDLSTTKKTYIKGEFISADLIVRNLLNQQIIIPSIHQLTGKLRLYGEDENGNLLEPSGLILEGPGDTMHIAGLMERWDQISIDLALGNHKPSPGVQEFKAGKYRVWVTLNDVFSNHIEFEVVQIPESEQRVYQKINDVLVYLPPTEEKVMLCQELIHTFPNSVLLPNVYNQLFGTLMNLRKTDELKQTSLKFIKENPELPYVKTAVYYYSRAVGQEDKISGVRTNSMEKKLLGRLHNLYNESTSANIQRYVNYIIIMTQKEWNRIEKQHQ